ncbi:hypothetical protein E1091_06540 [Micromonospora fluostatini]|uniref:Uncharacterized protein n=1 Tax=Micromonospora fluostatini TaxID=1629071 RepID=A0ABY2DLW2_9ACTN|nr:hypothetical protein E1091_06540 [Micromonospora fluostatini]
MSPSEPGASNEWLAEQIMHLLAHARDGEMAELHGHLEEIYERAKPKAIYAMCCALAAAFMQFSFGITERGAAQGAVVALGTDGPVNPDEARNPVERGMVWAARFVVAYMDADDGPAVALFDASLESLDEQHPHDVTQLALLAGAALRQHQSPPARPDPSLN